MAAPVTTAKGAR